jgi:FAD:protein FMN transferase
MRADVRFRAMGTDIHLIAVAGSARAASAAVDRGRERIEQLEALWSRFRPASEVSVMNALAGMPVRVSPETIALVQRALDGVRLTGGRFDPTVLGAVIRAGYDRTYTEIIPGAAPEDDRGLGAPRIEVDPVARLVRLPAGIGFDPGGIGKGLAADIVARELAERVAGICVNIGGDLRVHGVAPDGPAWGIEVEDPFGGAARGVLSLADGAVATSSRTQRVLRGGGHHLIDPATGLPAASGVASATAIAGQGWIAEVLAKASFLAGADEGCDLLETAGAAGMLVLDDGSERRTHGFQRFLGEEMAA